MLTPAPLPLSIVEAPAVEGVYLLAFLHRGEHVAYGATPGRPHAGAPSDMQPRPWIAVHVPALSAACHVAYFTVSHALAALRELGIVETRRHGPDGLTFRLTGEGLDALDGSPPPGPPR